jgi:hypothetical protein
MSSIAALQAQRSQVIQQIQELVADNEQKRRGIAQERARLASAQSAEEVGRLELSIRTLEAGIRVNQASIGRLEAILAEINAEINLLQLPTQSTGTTVREDQAARDEAANSQVPPQGNLVLDDDGRVVSSVPQVSTNAQRTPVSSGDDDAGNAPVRTATALQSTPPATASDPPPPSSTGPTASQTRGEAAPGDDNAVRSTLNAIFDPSVLGKKVAQPNVLDKYASYTYNISIYIMSPENYRYLLVNKQKNIPGWQLLMQSGGAPQTSGNNFPLDPQESEQRADGNGAAIDVRSLGRNQYFPLDFYIDDVRMRSLITGKGSQGAHNVVSLNFKVFEPNGITFIDRLSSAVKEYIGPSVAPGVPINYGAQNYLMVIRFYGYDENGNLAQPIKGGVLDLKGDETGSATIEKYIPFMFTGIKFRVANRIVEYECSAVCPQNGINSSRGRGVIPYNVEITAKSLKDLLAGDLTYSSPSNNAGEGRQQPQSLASGVDQVAAITRAGVGASAPQLSAVDQVEAITRAGVAQTASTPPPPKANAAPTPTITQGLAAALNQYQRQLKSEGKYDEVDVYEIEVLPPLADSKVVPPGTTDYKSKPMGPGSKAPANQQKNPGVGQVQKDAKVTSVLAGMSIVQFIDQYTRTSTYIYDQQLAYIDARGNQVNTPAASNQVLGWYRIGMEASPIKYDPKRNDYAYRIKYQLTPYKITNLQSDWFPESPFTGVHKEYNYWFTGINTQVLDLAFDFNTMYYLVISGQNLQETSGKTTNYREAYKKIAQPNSAQSNMGISGNENEPGANAADYLYSPGDVARVKMTIVGDPAWIQQGEVWSGVSGLQTQFGPFLDDGTINYDSQEILFKVLFNKPQDYNINSGIIDPNQRLPDVSPNDVLPGEATQTYVYRAIECTSVFAQGKFTQELHGTIILFDTDRPEISKNNDQSRQASPGVGISDGASVAALRRRDNEIAAANPEIFAPNIKKAPPSLNLRTDGTFSGPTGLIQTPVSPTLMTASPAGVPTSSGQPVGITSAVPGTNPPASPGSVSAQTSNTQITPLQQQIIVKRSELAAATARGNFAEATRLTGEINRLTADLARETPPIPAVRTQTIAKD